MMYGRGDTMSKIYAICTTFDAGRDYDVERLKESGIQVGDKLELEDAAVGGWHTDVWLEGHEKPFNSVFFDFVDENGREYNIYRDRNFSMYR